VLRLDSRSKLDYVSQEGGRRERAISALPVGRAHPSRPRPEALSDFIVESPEGVLEPSERGVYRLDVQPGEARVTVFDGEAAVEAGRRVRVDGGQQLIVREGEPYAGPEPISGYDADDAFARWDRDLEEQLAYADGRREEWLPEEVAPYAGDIASNGSWRVEGDYGYVWYPRVNLGWAPYSRGYWTWTLFGWTWIPTDRWGWATSHYGRWGYSDGWFWIPGAPGPGLGELVGGRRSRRMVPAGLGRSSRVRPFGPREGPWCGAARCGRTECPDLRPPRRHGPGDLAGRRVDPAQLATGDFRVAPAGQARLSRDLRLVEGAAGVSTGQPAPAAPCLATCSSSPRPATPCPELQADPKTTIRRPIPRRHREPEDTADEGGGDGQQRQSGSGVSVPRAPRTSAPLLVPGASAPPTSAPFVVPSAPRLVVPRASAPRQQRSNERPGEHRATRRALRRPPARGAAHAAPRPGGRSHAQRAGARDREILRPIFGPQPPALGRRRQPDRGSSRSDSASPRSVTPPSSAPARPERGGSERSGSDSGRTRPSGRPAPQTPAPPPSQPPAEQRAQPRERAAPRAELGFRGRPSGSPRGPLVPLRYSHFAWPRCRSPACGWASYGA
jgi:hypothetical protein